VPDTDLRCHRSGLEGVSPGDAGRDAVGRGPHPLHGHVAVGLEAHQRRGVGSQQLPDLERDRVVQRMALDALGGQSRQAHQRGLHVGEAAAPFGRGRRRLVGLIHRLTTPAHASQRGALACHDCPHESLTTVGDYAKRRGANNPRAATRANRYGLIRVGGYRLTRAGERMPPARRRRRRATVAIDTLIAFVGIYDSVEEAEADYQAVKALHTEAGLIDAYDAAVVERREDGKTKIVKKHETPTRVGGVLGGGVGLATGLVVVLFPFAAVGGGILAGTTAGGAILGAVAGHAAAGMSRHDLKDLGEHLDKGTAGLVVVAVSDMGAKVERAMERAAKLEQKELKADTAEIERDADAAAAAGTS
jgi:uncharacterized membrane protein